MGRKEYRKELAEEYNVPLSVVYATASVLGPSGYNIIMTAP